MTRINISELSTYFQYHTIKECSGHFGISMSTVRRQLRNAGIDTTVRSRVGNRRQIDTEDITQYYNGHTIQECAVHFDCSLSLIRNRLRGAGVKTEFSPHKIDIDIDKLTEYFKDHTLKQCAERYHCATSTIKKMLRQVGIDTSIHNNGDLAKQIHREAIQKKKNTSFLTKEFLSHHYITENKDSKTIAEENNLHYNTVLQRLRQYGIKKSGVNVAASMSVRYQRKTGYAHPGHHPDTITKIQKRRSRYKYNSIKSGTHLFRSLHELCYAILLDSDINVISWDYELINIPYIDRITGRRRQYYIDFSVQCSDKNDKWIEVKPADKMIPHDKYLYATHAAKHAGIKFSGQSNQERQDGFRLFLDGYGDARIEFINISELKLDRKYTLWFRSRSDIETIEHDHYRSIKEVGKYVKCTFTPKTKHKSISAT